MPAGIGYGKSMRGTKKITKPRGKTNPKMKPKKDYFEMASMDKMKMPKGGKK